MVQSFTQCPWAQRNLRTHTTIDMAPSTPTSPPLLNFWHCSSACYKHSPWLLFPRSDSSGIPFHIRVHSKGCAGVPFNDPIVFDADCQTIFHGLFEIKCHCQHWDFAPMQSNMTLTSVCPVWFFYMETILWPPGHGNAPSSQVMSSLLLWLTLISPSHEHDFSLTFSSIGYIFNVSCMHCIILIMMQPFLLWSHSNPTCVCLLPTAVFIMPTFS